MTLEDRVRWLIATGYADKAGEAAKELASYVLDERMGRRVDEYTGGVYFEDPYPYEY